MKNPFIYSSDNKRYQTWNYYLKQKFGQKVCKIPVSGNFTCPNRDGTKSFDGCVFCSGSSHGEIIENNNLPISQQLNIGRSILSKKWPNSLFLPYFSYNSSTYGKLSKIKPLFEEALNYKKTVGLCVATRADCLNDDICDYLGELNNKTNLYIEIGLQTIHDKTANLLNRQHSYKEFLNGYNKLISKNIKVCIHIINSLPGETKPMMIETAKAISNLNPFAIKIHMLYVAKGTTLERWYKNNQFSLMSREEYIDTVCDQIEILSPKIVIERLTGDCVKESLIAPMWSLKKVTILNDIDKELVRRNSFQGCKLK